ncbi:NUDIX hydrolase [Clostridium sp. CF012]|uniref:NUDIX hydrolase n=1 Tax=Clostridium sp. CF012 TaxID=2843319 RepID=UPI001C0DB81B|nr:NUDIX domain-containing protein [Clostridium sp. CF012]MBU3144870.1 NUDIX domain-containing protein [Clostridium sp. CF012]
MTVVAGCVVQDNNRILMVQEGQGVEKELWNFPSGRLENNEKILNAAIREVEEETGYKISISGLLGIYNFISINNVHVIFFCYVGQVTNGILRYDNNEIIDVKWLSPDEIAGISDNKLRTHTLIRRIISDLKSKPILPLNIINDMI